jgi:hypothetical protein
MADVRTDTREHFGIAALTGDAIKFANRRTTYVLHYTCNLTGEVRADVQTGTRCGPRIAITAIFIFVVGIIIIASDGDGDVVPTT